MKLNLIKKLHSIFGRKTLTTLSIFDINSLSAASLWFFSFKKSWYNLLLRSPKPLASIDVRAAFNSLIPLPFLPKTIFSICCLWYFNSSDVVVSKPVSNGQMKVVEV